MSLTLFVGTHHMIPCFSGKGIHIYIYIYTCDNCKVVRAPENIQLKESYTGAFFRGAKREPVRSLTGKRYEMRTKNAISKHRILKARISISFTRFDNTGFRLRTLRPSSGTFETWLFLQNTRPPNMKRMLNNRGEIIALLIHRCTTASKYFIKIVAIPLNTYNFHYTIFSRRKNNFKESRSCLIFLDFSLPV